MRFVAVRRRPIYPTLSRELDAIASRDKPISFWLTDAEGVAHGEVEPILRAALKRDLATAIVPRGDDVDVFVYRDARRIAPLQTLLARSPWTFALEEELGLLLGYTPTQRREWMAAEHALYVAYGATTMYRHGDRVFLAPGRTVADPHGVERFGVDPRVAHKIGTRTLDARTDAKLRAAIVTPIQAWTARGWR